MHYHAVGFRECITEVARYFNTFERLEMEDPLKHGVISHLQCYLAQRELSLKSAAGAHSAWNPSLFHNPQHFSPHSLGSDSSSSSSAASLNSVSSTNNNSGSQNQHNNSNNGNTAPQSSSAANASNSSSSAVTTNSSSNNQNNNASALSATSPNASLQFALNVKMSGSPAPASPASPASHVQPIHATSPLDAQAYAHALQRHAGNELLSAMMPPPPPPPALLHKVQTSLTSGSCTGSTAVGELSTYTNMHCAYPPPHMAATSVASMSNDLNHMHPNLSTSGIPNPHVAAVSYASTAAASQAYAAAAAAAQHAPYFGSQVSLAYGGNSAAAAAAAAANANAAAAAHQQSAKYCRPWGAEVAY